jgi:hypothetical protein
MANYWNPDPNDTPKNHKAQATEFENRLLMIRDELATIFDAVWESRQGRISTLLMKRGRSQIVCRVLIRVRASRGNFSDVKFSHEDFVGCKKLLPSFKEPLYLVFSYNKGELIWTRFDDDLVKGIEASKAIKGFPDIPLQYFQKLGQPIPVHKIIEKTNP